MVFNSIELWISCQWLIFSNRFSCPIWFKILHHVPPCGVDVTSKVLQNPTGQLRTLLTSFQHLYLCCSQMILWNPFLGFTMIFSTKIEEICHENKNKILLQKEFQYIMKKTTSYTRRATALLWVLFGSKSKNIHLASILSTWRSIFTIQQNL